MDGQRLTCHVAFCQKDQTPRPEIIGHEVAAGGAPSVYLVRNPDNHAQELVLPFQTVARAFGLTNEALLAVVMHRLDCFQAGQFRSTYNAEAATHLACAMHALHCRTADRKARGVEGKLVT